MATKPAPKRAFKPAPKPAPKPVPKPAEKNLKPRAVPFQTPQPAPLDLVRNANFDAAMAQQNYANFMADQQARLAAQQGQFTQGRLMGAPTNQPIPPGGGLGGLTADQAGISPEQMKILDDLMARQKADIAARELEQQNMMKEGKFTIGGTAANPIYGTMAGPVYANGSLVNPPKAQDQAAINNIRAQFDQFLKQGIDRGNTMNQDAMTNFANMQPGIESTQPATTTTPKPAMPVAGMGMQKSSPAPRKFSTVNTPSARFA